MGRNNIFVVLTVVYCLKNTLLLVNKGLCLSKNKRKLQTILSFPDVVLQVKHSLFLKKISLAAFNFPHVSLILRRAFS